MFLYCIQVVLRLLLKAVIILFSPSLKADYTSSGSYSVFSHILMKELGTSKISPTNDEFSVQNIFGFLPSFIRRKYPSQRSLRWRSIVKIVGSPNLDSTNMFGGLIVHDIHNNQIPHKEHIKTVQYTLLSSIHCSGCGSV